MFHSQCKLWHYRRSPFPNFLQYFLKLTILIIWCCYYQFTLTAMWCCGEILKQPFNLFLREMEIPSWIYCAIGIGTLTSIIERFDKIQKQSLMPRNVVDFCIGIVFMALSGYFMWSKKWYDDIFAMMMDVMLKKVIMGRVECFCWYYLPSCIITFNFQAGESN